MSLGGAQGRVLKALVHAAAVLLWLMVVPCQAVTTLTLGHLYTAEHPMAKACQRFVDTVKKRSEGRIQFQLYIEGRMGNQTAMLRSLKNGSLDLMVNSHGSVADMVPEFNALGLPYLFSDPDLAWRVLEGPIGKQLAQKSEAKGLILLSFWGIDVRSFSNSVRPITKPADMAGLKIRVPPDPLTVDIVLALGGKPQEINFSDLYRALQMGVVEGQDNAYMTFRDSRFYEVQKYYSLTGHKYSVHAFLMSKLAWDGLSANDREILRTAAQEAAQYQRWLARNLEEEIYRDLTARGVRINKVDPKPFVAATAPIYDKWYSSLIGDFVRAVVKAAREKP
ncbi:MAG: TRAP transporter substrate-binding protein [Betaproteobacteria bacterium]